MVESRTGDGSPTPELRDVQRKVEVLETRSRT